MTLIEKAARAIDGKAFDLEAEALRSDWPSAPLVLEEARRRISVARDSAIAALKAMREPTKTMLDATGEPGVPDEHYAEIWQAMIDQAIKEGE